MNLTINHSAGNSFIAIGKEKINIDNNTRSNRILEVIEQILTEQNKNISVVKEIVICLQPGSFTSIRVIASITNALSKSLNIPIKDENGNNISLAIPKYSRPASITNRNLLISK